MSMKAMVVVWISQLRPNASAMWAIFIVPVTPAFHDTSARTMSAAFCMIACATPQCAPRVVSVAATAMSSVAQSDWYFASSKSRNGSSNHS